MYYISSDTNSIYSVVDTTDSTVESYTLNQLKDIRRYVDIQGVSSDCSHIIPFDIQKIYSKGLVVNGLSSSEDRTLWGNKCMSRVRAFIHCNLSKLSITIRKKYKTSISKGTSGDSLFTVYYHNFVGDNIGCSRVRFPCYYLLDVYYRGYFWSTTDTPFTIIVEDEWKMKFGMSDTNTIEFSAGDKREDVAMGLKCTDVIDMFSISEATLEDFFIKWFESYGERVKTAEWFYNSGVSYGKRLNEFSLK